MFKKNESAENVLDLYMKETLASSATSTYSTVTPIQMKFPHPNLLNLREMSMLTVLQINKQSKHIVEQFNQHINKGTVGRDFGKFVESGLVESDDLNELIAFNRDLEQSF